MQPEPPLSLSFLDSLSTLESSEGSLQTSSQLIPCPQNLSSLSFPDICLSFLSYIIIIFISPFLQQYTGQRNADTVKSERSLEAVDPDMNSSVLFPVELTLISELRAINSSYFCTGLSDSPMISEQFKSVESLFKICFLFPAILLYSFI